MADKITQEQADRALRLVCMSHAFSDSGRVQEAISIIGASRILAPDSLDVVTLEWAWNNLIMVGASRSKLSAEINRIKGEK